jgi:hypothetical protein
MGWQLYCIKISGLLFSQKSTSDRKIFMPFKWENYIKKVEKIWMVDRDVNIPEF